MSTQAPLFSVIIPAYNTAPYIQQTLRSVYQQTETDFEIIVINDGSTDNLAEILAQETDPRLQVITQENGGVSRARNKGIQLARGEYLAFLDSDDVWFPFHLEKAREFFEKHPQYHWYATKLIPTNEIEDKDFSRQAPAEYVYYASNWFLEFASVPISQTAVLKREYAARHLHFPEGIKMCEDNVAWSRYALGAGSIGTIDYPTCLYRQREDSATQAYWQQWQRDNARLGLDALLLQQQMLQDMDCPKEARLYFKKRSLTNWSAHLNCMNTMHWRNELNLRKCITGAGITYLLRIYIYATHLITRVTNKVIIRKLNNIQKKLDAMLSATKTRLD